MLKEFQEYIISENLIRKKDKVLLAVSGGIDSVSMVHLFARLDYDCTIAHCNFQLRGNESDQDEEFVKQISKEQNIPIETIRFNTSDYAKSNKLSIQMAARELRYNWFNQLALEKGFKAIAIAHNMNDLVETFHINMIRGTGLHGLCAFLPKQKNLIRPLLFAKRSQINEYVEENGLEYRTDSSNTERKYLRNAIRHDIIPEFEKLNKNYLVNSQNTIHILQSIRSFLLTELSKLREKLIYDQNGFHKIKIRELLQSELSSEILYELLSEYNFNYSTIGNIEETIKLESSGQLFFSTSHELLINRDELLIRKNQKGESFREYRIEENTLKIEEPLSMELTTINWTEQSEIPKDKNEIALDFDKLNFPLIIRKWNNGDSFVPLGMKGHKKISDFFINNKISLFEKENTWLLTSGEEIVWVIKHRTSDEFKITSNTTRALFIKIRK